MNLLSLLIMTLIEIIFFCVGFGGALALVLYSMSDDPDWWIAFVQEVKEDSYE